jgi:hypothetical protein
MRKLGLKVGPGPMTPPAGAAVGAGVAGADPARVAAASHIRAAQARVDDVVRRHFRLRGSLRLHGAALGGDMLRAPVNLMLAPIHALLLLVAFGCARIGARRLAGWLRGRRVMLPTRVGARVEEVLVVELLGLPWPQAGADHDAAMLRAILSAPQLRPLWRAQSDPAVAEAGARRMRELIARYAGTRVAVAEIVTALVLLVVGALVFRALTPGMISLAPNLAGVVAHGAAVADFPLGQTLGGVWYAVFPVGVPPWLMAAVVALLVSLGAVMAAFAGILADPVQARLGVHQRRLHRLIAALAAEVAEDSPRGFAAHEHAVARVVDVWDALASLARALRG